MSGLDAIRLRDPFVLPQRERGWYYLYGTTDPDCWGPRGVGFDAYRSRDLKDWEGPFSVFRPPTGFWADRHFWAPEVFLYQDRWFMFASFKTEGRSRGTQILQGYDPLGPFTIHSSEPVTPSTDECLDGTLFLERDGQPWMVYCHEWTQITDGALCAVPLSADLSAAAGPPVTLFHGSEAPWARGFPEDPARRVTDGPWLHRLQSGRLVLLWSSFGEHGYALGQAFSMSGELKGPWIHDPTPLFARDGGHGMVFRDFEGSLQLALHQPNRSPDERPQFFPLIETSERLALA